MELHNKSKNFQEKLVSLLEFLHINPVGTRDEAMNSHNKEEFINKFLHIYTQHSMADHIINEIDKMFKESETEDADYYLEDLAGEEDEDAPYDISIEVLISQISSHLYAMNKESNFTPTGFSINTNANGVVEIRILPEDHGNDK